MVTYHCPICFKNFASSPTLKRHTRRIHPESEQAKALTKNIKYSSSVICPLCRATVDRYQVLVEHLSHAHNLPMKEEAHDFLTVRDFENWKQQIEKVTESSFVKLRGRSEVKRVRGTKDVYVCHRSGRCRGVNGERVRKMKSQGSQKFEAFCPARMKVVIAEGGRVFLNFQPMHVGHSVDPVYLRLTRSEKEMIAKKIAGNLPLDDILREIRESTEPLGRLKLLTKQDLQNIRRDANLLASVYSQNGSNIDEWVNQHKDYILSYKPKGAQLDPFLPEDFILCLMNPKNHPSPEFTCLDAFETKSPDELSLFAVSSADENAIPLAIIISNRRDFQLLDYFLQKLSSQLDLNPCCTFSARNSTLYGAWKKWFKVITYKVGSWQIEEEWRANLIKMITNIPKKLNIFRALKSLLEVPNEEAFKDTCKYIRDAAKDESEEFESYFCDLSASYEDWVKFNRSAKLMDIHAGFYKLYKNLKSVHLRLRKYEALEALLNSLVEIMDFETGGVGRKALKEIADWHKTAMNVDFTITLEDEDTWKVQFQGHQEADCEVKKADVDCPCQLKCKDCKFCRHAFKCTCTDWANGNMCKHVHSVCMSLFSDDCITIEEQFEELEPEPETYEVIISESVKNVEVEDGKLELQQDFSQILSMIRTMEDVNLVQNAFRLITPSLGLNKETSSVDANDDIP